MAAVLFEESICACICPNIKSQLQTRICGFSFARKGHQHISCQQVGSPLDNYELAALVGRQVPWTRWTYSTYFDAVLHKGRPLRFVDPNSKMKRENDLLSSGLLCHLQNRMGSMLERRRPPQISTPIQAQNQPESPKRCYALSRFFRTPIILDLVPYVTSFGGQ